MVVLSHLSTYHADLLGPAGVGIFFVLSGFLITSLLVAERERFGQVSLKDFYVRRGLRLFPALLLVVVATPVVLSLTGDARVHDILPWVLTSVFYVQDFFTATGHSSPLAHTWSLSVEEQFYLVWPLLLGLITARAGGDRARLARTVRTLWCVALVWHLIAVLTLGPDWPAYSPDSNAVFLLTGCWVATAVRAGQTRRVPTPIALGGLAVVCLAPLVLTRLAEAHGRATALAMLPVVLLSALLVLAAGQLKVLENPVLRWFGTISYGLYLWNWVFISLEPHNRHLSGRERAIGAVLAVGISAASWYGFEKPILRLKSRFQRVSSIRTTAAPETPAVPMGSYPTAAATAPIPVLAEPQRRAEFAPTLRRGATPPPV